jgi:hypothetical protein
VAAGIQSWRASSHTDITIHRRQQQALATQGDTRTPVINADCGQVVEDEERILIRNKNGIKT